MMCPRSGVLIPASPETYSLSKLNEIGSNAYVPQILETQYFAFLIIKNWIFLSGCQKFHPLEFLLANLFKSKDPSILFFFLVTK